MDCHSYTALDRRPQS